MEALRSLRLLSLLIGCYLAGSTTWGATTVRSRHFLVTAANPQLAQEIAQAAEGYRRDLALEWLGRELAPWPELCPITAQVDPNMGAGGATSFTFAGGQPRHWTMTVQGSRERVLDSVLPHEITHTIFATHFGRPLPRWADEGACTTVEHASERGKQEKMLYQFLTTNRGIPFNRMYAMTEYPRDILPLYSQGYSLARFLIALGGKPKFVEYVGRGMETNHWTNATRDMYGFDSLSDLQLSWLEWVRQGTPEIRDPAEVKYVSADAHKQGKTLADMLSGGRSPASASVATKEVNNATLLASGNNATLIDRRVPTNRLPDDVEPTQPTGGSWYARQRDLKSSAPYDVPSQGLSRPQPPQTVRETPLEWSSSAQALAPAATRLR